MDREHEQLELSDQVARISKGQEHGDARVRDGARAQDQVRKRPGEGEILGWGKGSESKDRTSIRDRGGKFGVERGDVSSHHED